MSINYRSLKIEYSKPIRLLLFFFFVLLFLPLAAQEKLRVDGDLTVKSADSGAARYGLVLTPQNATPSAQEGQIYYNDANNVNQPRYYDGANWKNLGGDDKYVATRVVAASDSLDTTCADGVCSNPRADYTCDGTNDQQEINRAFKSTLPADGGAVYLLEGTYNISTALLEGESLVGIVPHSNTALIGTGRGTVLKVFLNASSLRVINASSVNRILISQLMIDGNSKTGSLNRGINFNAVTYSKIDKVWVENMSEDGIRFESSSNNTISGNNIQYNKWYGIGFLSNSNNNIISGNNIYSNQSHGIYLGPGSNNTISNNNIQLNRDPAGAGVAGICLYNPSNNNTISGNNIYYNGTYGIYVMQGYYNIISGNNIQLNSQFGICLADGDSSTVSGNNIQGNVQHGIYTSGAGGSIITANVIYDNGGSGAFDGINLNDDNIIISSNRIYDSAGSGYGIKISGSNNYLIGNLIDGVGYTQPIQDLGTGTKYTDKAKMTLERQAVLSVFNDTTITPTGPASYVPVVGNGGAVIANANTPIAAGKAAGDILILEGTDNTNTVTIPDSGNVKLKQDRPLGWDDVLTLIYTLTWNGTDWVGTWVEMDWANNSP